MRFVALVAGAMTPAAGRLVFDSTRNGAVRVLKPSSHTARLVSQAQRQQDRHHVIVSLMLQRRVTMLSSRAGNRVNSMAFATRAAPRQGDFPSRSNASNLERSTR